MNTTKTKTLAGEQNASAHPAPYGMTVTPSDWDADLAATYEQAEAEAERHYGPLTDHVLLCSPGVWAVRSRQGSRALIGMVFGKLTLREQPSPTNPETAAGSQNASNYEIVADPYSRIEDADVKEGEEAIWAPESLEAGEEPHAIVIRRTAAQSQNLSAKIPCECGSKSASWHGPRDGRREYCCDACYRGFEPEEDYIHLHDEEKIS